MVNEKTLETIGKMKLLVLKRCEERIQNASGRAHSKPPESSYSLHCHGVTAILRQHHGL